MDDWERSAMNCIFEILGEDVVPLEDILAQLPEVSINVQRRRRLLRKLDTEDKLEDFLKKHEHLFFVENRRAAVRGMDLVVGRVAAVTYFENELDLYDEPPNYLNFRGHLGQAGESVIDFINSFYPGEEFRNFLLANPEVFHVLEDDTVILIENASVDYFSERLEDGRGGLHFMRLRGHVGQAPEHVIEFLNAHYPGERFLEFLERNDDVFTIDEENCVFLTPDEN